MKLNNRFIQQLLLVFVLLSSSAFYSQELTDKAGVSIITCGPGNELYSTFGHSALRVYDYSLGLDIVYNYGTFDFNAPNFYLNFAKGKLTYQLSTTHFSLFLREYQYYNRWVKTQDLDLTPSEVKAVFAFLQNNALPANRDYQYDFFYDNCSTKLEEVLNKVLPNKLTFSNNHITTEKTHRDLIADYTKNQKWGKFGIDLALGSVIDKKATKDDYKFIPDYMFQAFENATITEGSTTKPLVKKEQTIIIGNPVTQPQFGLSTSPLLVLSLLAMVIVFITYKNQQSNKRSRALDFSIYFITGLIGIVVLLMWFASSHKAAYNNLNFLWAFAPNAVVAFYLLKNNLPKWMRRYTQLTLGLLIASLVVWLFQIQNFNAAILPLLLALIIRNLFILKRS